MTVIIGALCQDGIVIGSDSSTTFATGGYRTVEQITKKVTTLAENILLCGTGQVGLDQRFQYVINKYWQGNQQDGKTHEEITLDLATLLKANFTATGAQIEYGACLAFAIDNNIHLYEFPSGTLQPEYKTKHLWYVSMGSGQLIADPFLGFVRKMFWNDKQPNINDGIFGTIWALQHTI
ncbi:MAG: hypothetical protein IH950_15540, partial [Bacteroidetes bacterium]|nr:hypothetical protein [Bacteroidota bacterium]